MTLQTLDTGSENGTEQNLYFTDGVFYPKALVDLATKITAVPELMNEGTLMSLETTRLIMEKAYIEGRKEYFEEWMKFLEGLNQSEDVKLSQIAAQLWMRSFAENDKPENKI
jgi:hypothetical protein